MIRIAVVSAFIVSIFFGCKTTKKAEYVSPHTDTIKVAVRYQPDSVEAFVKKIIESDSLFNLKETQDYSIVSAVQQDSILFLTVSSYTGCAKIEFDLYQSPFVFKTYPVQIRCRLAKSEEKDCDEENAGRINMYTMAYDIRGILDTYTEANIVFTGSQIIARLKKEK